MKKTRSCTEYHFGVVRISSDGSRHVWVKWTDLKGVKKRAKFGYRYKGRSSRYLQHSGARIPSGEFRDVCKRIWSLKETFDNL